MLEAVLAMLDEMMMEDVFVHEIEGGIEVHELQDSIPMSWSDMMDDLDEYVVEDSEMGVRWLIDGFVIDYYFFFEQKK